MDDSDLLAFSPVPLRARADGWTPRKQYFFILGLARSFKPGQAAASRRSVRDAPVLAPGDTPARDRPADAAPQEPAAGLGADRIVEILPMAEKEAEPGPT